MKYQSKFLSFFDKLVKIAICLLPLILLSFVIEKNYAFSGHKDYVYDFEKDSPFISHLEPWNRLSPISEEDSVYSQSMKDDSVYFNVKKPLTSFEKITVKVTYQNPSAEMLDVGLRISQKDDYLKLPLESKLIDSLQWSKLESADGIMYQKNKEFSSFEDFYQNFPPDKKIISHNFNIKKHVSEEKTNHQNITPLRPSIKIENFDIVVTNYKTPTTSSSWQVAKNTFNYGHAYVDENDMMRFMLAAPGLRQEGAEIKIEQIELQFERAPYTAGTAIDKLKKFFKL
ncbi:hypothetical protein KKC60_00250 [Patescibacteria group bacterium]|nr:hypothetical protein [Patescibacteria group bacterium]